MVGAELGAGIVCLWKAFEDEMVVSLFLKYRHFPFWIPHLTDYQLTILNFPEE
jgi:hypothetical protein